MHRSYIHFQHNTALNTDTRMLRMSRVISLHSQFLCDKVWQLAAGASTAGFLERVAADLERELRTFKYPAMSPNLRLTLDGTQSKRGGKALPSSVQYREQQWQHRPSSLPGGTRWTLRQSHRAGGGTETNSRLNCAAVEPSVQHRVQSRVNSCLLPKDFQSLLFLFYKRLLLWYNNAQL